MVLAHILLLTSIAAVDSRTASCKLRDSSVLSHSSAGLAQVSNLRLIEIRCSIPARPFPMKPGDFRNGLRATATAYQIGRDGRKEVPSEANPSGFGDDEGAGNGSQELVLFAVNLPLDPTQRDLEFHRWLEKLQEKSQRQLAANANPQAMEMLSQAVSQNRAGHFLIECRVLDGSRVIGVGSVEFEVLFKGRFSDQGGFPGAWPGPSSPIGR